MAGAAAIGPALSAIGGGISAFGSSDYSPISFSKGAKKNIEWLNTLLKPDTAKYEDALSNFENANQRRIQNFNIERPLARSDYDYLFQTGKNYDPASEAKSWVDFGLNRLNTYTGNLVDAGRRADALAMARLGYNPARGSWQDALLADRAFRATAPLAATLIGTGPAATTAFQSNRANNLANMLQVLGLRTATPDIGYGAELAPIEARLATRSGEADWLNQLVNAARANTAGWVESPDTVARIGQAFSNVGGALSPGLGGSSGAVTQTPATFTNTSTGTGSGNALLDWLSAMLKNTSLNRSLGGLFGEPTPTTTGTATAYDTYQPGATWDELLGMWRS